MKNKNTFNAIHLKLKFIVVHKKKLCLSVFSAIVEGIKKLFPFQIKKYIN